MTLTVEVSDGRVWNTDQPLNKVDGVFTGRLVTISEPYLVDGIAKRNVAGIVTVRLTLTRRKRAYVLEGKWVEQSWGFQVKATLGKLDDR
jgi:hypothetical protein